MQSPSVSTPDITASRHRQRGVYALEWAIIFPVFFMLLYAILSYGLTFLTRESMQHAVEEGARAALRYPLGVVSPDWNHRKAAAIASIQSNLAWLPASIRPTDANIKFTVCRISDSTCTADTALNPKLSCDVNLPCMVYVSYSISNYNSGAIAPAIPGLGLILPSSLQANASLVMDRRVL